MKVLSFYLSLVVALILAGCASTPVAEVATVPAEPTATLIPVPQIRTATPRPPSPTPTARPPATETPVPPTRGPLADAADTLGITEPELAAVLGDPNAGPPNLAEAAAALGIPEQRLAEVLGIHPTEPPDQEPTSQIPNPTGQVNTGRPVLTPASIATAIVTGNGADARQLPIGDYRVSNGPLQNFVWSCQTNFNGEGALAPGGWFNGAAGTFNLNGKPVVDGSIAWPFELSITLDGDQRRVVSNNLPNHRTGVYPVSEADDAYAFDPNPNTIASQPVQFALPASPRLAARATCVPGEVGILLTGSLLFNAFDAAGRDAVAHEIQDICGGHPQSAGLYHYHSLTGCLVDSTRGHSPLIGYAFDGFGIYGHHGENGAALTNADLDACHGHTHLIEWDGEQVMMYHYHATNEFPYVIGCYRGTAIQPDLPSEGPPP